MEFTSRSNCADVARRRRRPVRAEDETGPPLPDLDEIDAADERLGATRRNPRCSAISRMRHVSAWIDHGWPATLDRACSSVKWGAFANLRMRPILQPLPSRRKHQGLQAALEVRSDGFIEGWVQRGGLRFLADV
eukprot:Skav203222  [mRNA]  locus=scaffold2292:208053:223563:+ [translate_table: standard]